MVVAVVVVGRFNRGKREEWGWGSGWSETRQVYAVPVVESAKLFEEFSGDRKADTHAPAAQRSIGLAREADQP